MEELKDLQLKIADLVDQHKYFEAEELSAIEFVKIMNIEANWPGAFDNA